MGAKRMPILVGLLIVGALVTCLWLLGLAVGKMFFPTTPTPLLAFVIFFIGCLVPPHVFLWWLFAGLLLLTIGNTPK
jgi:hypothetical protein